MKTNKEYIEGHERDLKDLQLKKKELTLNLYDVDCEIIKTKKFIEELGQQIETVKEKIIMEMQIFEDMNKVFNLTIYVGNKTCCLDITEQQAEKLKKNLDVDIIYIPF